MEGQRVAVSETSWSRYGSQGEDNPRGFLFEGIRIGYDYCSTAAYLHLCYKFLPSQKTDIVYDRNGQNPVENRAIYEYNPYGLVRKIEQMTSDNTTRRQEMKYPFDFQVSPYTYMVSKHILSPVIETTVFNNTAFVEMRGHEYDLRHGTLCLPVNLKYKKGSGNLEVIETYLYDMKANIQEIQRNDADKICYIWGYNYRYPIAEIRNATYSQVLGKINQATLTSIASKNKPSTSDLALIDGLRSSLPDAQVTTYSYNPSIGMTSKTDPNGIITIYEYDTFGRLHYIKDHNGKIIEQYNYHYKQ